MKIIYAEDNASCYLIVSKVLEKLGHEVIHAVDAYAAQAVISSGRKFDILLAVHIMPVTGNRPDYTGADLILWTRYALPDTPAVLITATPPSPAVLNELFKVKVGIVVKPMDTEFVNKLAKRLQLILDGNDEEFDDVETS